MSVCLALLWCPLCCSFALEAGQLDLPIWTEVSLFLFLFICCFCFVLFFLKNKHPLFELNVEFCSSEIIAVLHLSTVLQNNFVVLFEYCFCLFGCFCFCT